MLRCILLIFLTKIVFGVTLNLDYLDPTKLQTSTTSATQERAASNFISKYSDKVVIKVDPFYFKNNKDSFTLRTSHGKLYINASTGVAAIWGFNYYLKKYCKSQIAWQVERVSIPDPLPDVNETIVANDRFRYYQNVCTASYSFVWWSVTDWLKHVEWMALNGINLALAPVAQEAAWIRVYVQLGMTNDEMENHFTGPAFLSWLRMGNVHGWGGPLLPKWHDRQIKIQNNVIDYMYRLGIVPVFPAFNGHVPKAFARIFPNTTFHLVSTWNKFSGDFCCGLFLDPSDPLFNNLGRMFLKEITRENIPSHIYTADPFNEVNIQTWSTDLVVKTANAIYSTLRIFDENAVWLLQNWMFVSAPLMWPIYRVKSFLSSVPNGRMLILDLQAEQWPQYNLYEMYYGQPFIWCMLHNFGGTLGMFGNMITINKEVYYVRSSINSTMIGIGLTPEGINQNYVVYDLMLESAWRVGPVEDLDLWASEYAERRYGCNATTDAWKYLLKSVYSFNSLNRVRGKYVITRRPSFKIRPWAWYKSYDLFSAFRKFATQSRYCYSEGFLYDVVDVTRQALQYRSEQLYNKILDSHSSSSWVFNATITQFLDAMNDMRSILYTSKYFSAYDWEEKANSFSEYSIDSYSYILNYRNQITQWGPNGEISDYACKQWAELFEYYYIPRWSTFLNAALDAKINNDVFDEARVQSIIKTTVEKNFLSVTINSVPSFISSQDLAVSLYYKWAYVPNLTDLPQRILRTDPNKRTTLADVADDDEDTVEPTVFMIRSTTPIR